MKHFGVQKREKMSSVERIRNEFMRRLHLIKLDDNVERERRSREGPVPSMNQPQGLDAELLGAGLRHVGRTGILGGRKS